MNPTKNLIEPKPYTNPTKNLIELKLHMVQLSKCSHPTKPNLIFVTVKKKSGPVEKPIGPSPP